MDIKTLAASLLGAVNNAPDFGANINDTAANTGQMQNIRNLGALHAKGSAGSQASKALGVGAGQQADNEEAQRKASEAAAAAAEADEQERIARELKRLQDPNEYKAIINDRGGYDFNDPLGNKISAVEYARKRNMHLSDVYKDSKDPDDKDFLEDYARVMELGKAVQSGDKKARDKIFEKDPIFKKAYEKSTLEEIVNDLHTEYPGYFRSNEEQRNRSQETNTTPLDRVGVSPTDQRSTLTRVKDRLIPFDSKSGSRWW